MGVCVCVCVCVCVWNHLVREAPSLRQGSFHRGDTYVKHVRYSIAIGEQKYSQENLCLSLFLINLQAFSPELY